jgi:phosphoglycolate phosphatase
MTNETASSSNPFRAIIFDLDGTLLNTLDDIAVAMNQVLLDNSFPPHPIDMYKYYIGNGMEKLIERTLPSKATSETSTPKYLKAFRAAYADTWHTSTRPYPGIPDMLTRLNQQDIRLAILSNKAHEFTTQMVSKLLGQWEFQIVLGASSDFPKKPNPKSALYILKQLNLRRDECLLVGDSGVDMQTATAAGIFPVGVTWGFRSESELFDNGCRFIARQPSDIFDFLKDDRKIASRF